MPTILKTKSIYYNDVNLIAQPSKITSRYSDVHAELHRIIVSPMAAVVGEKFATTASKLGLTVCLHRFCSAEQEAEIFGKLNNKGQHFVSIGLNDWERVKILSEAGATNWLIDTANGYLQQINDVIQKLNTICKVSNIMVGNIMTQKGFENFDKWNNIFVRVGIGNGSACSTPDATGFNRGQITELMEIYNYNQCKNSTVIDKTFIANNHYIVADGGIKNGNYAAKAFGCGADYVMLGGFFSKAIEAETHIKKDGRYWGGASKLQQEMYGGIKRHSEGKVKEIKETPVPLKELVDELWGGLTSAVGYSGCKSLTEFIGHGVFEIKENSLPPRGRLV